MIIFFEEAYSDRRSIFLHQTIDLEYKLKPFIPDYIPAVGDIDAFLKVRICTENARGQCTMGRNDYEIDA